MIRQLDGTRPTSEGHPAPTAGRIPGDLDDISGSRLKVMTGILRTVPSVYASIFCVIVAGVASGQEASSPKTMPIPPTWRRKFSSQSTWEESYI